MNHSTISTLDKVRSLRNPEGPLPVSHDPSFEASMTDANDDIPISAWDGALGDESQHWDGEAVASATEKCLKKLIIFLKKMSY